MTIHTAEELADAADAELKAIAAAKTELRQAPECRPGCICHCNKTTCACWDYAGSSRRRGYSAIRLPWIKKGAPDPWQSDPEEAPC